MISRFNLDQKRLIFYENPETNAVIICNHLGIILNILGEITGKVYHDELLENIFSDRLEDGQLDECPLTLEEVSKIKRSFVKTTLNMLHTRVEYPAEEKNNGNRRDTFTPFNERKS